MASHLRPLAGGSLGKVPVSQPHRSAVNLIMLPLI
jgi:hypothetical protein